MRTTRKSTIIVVGGALAVASVGYGLGTQADDGTAVAGGDQTTSEESRGGARAVFLHGGQPPGFQDLAATLGVDADELAQAFRDFHDSAHGDRRDEFAASLAGALGISPDKVTAAFERLHQRHEARFAARLADALGVDADEVQAALEKLKDDTPRPPDEFEQALADELGVDAADVRRALFESRADGGRGHRRPAMPLRGLASALDVTPAELRKALRELRADATNGFEERHKALAKFLADRFNVDVDKVSDALSDLPRPVGPGRGGRPGPGGPGSGHGPGGPGMFPAPQPG
jgi:transcriptional regulator with XRE-family HTH domain